MGSKNRCVCRCPKNAGKKIFNCPKKKDAEKRKIFNE